MVRWLTHKIYIAAGWTVDPEWVKPFPEEEEEEKEEEEEEATSPSLSGEV